MPETLRFRVASGCCAACAGDVEGALVALPGAEDVQVLAGADVVTVARAMTGTRAVEPRTDYRFPCKPPVRCFGRPNLPGLGLLLVVRDSCPARYGPRCCFCLDARARPGLVGRIPGCC